MSFKDSNVFINEISLNSEVGALTTLLNEYEILFKNELGTYKYEKIKLDVEDNVKPIFCKPSPIPFAFREKVKCELERLEADGVIEKVPNTLWGTPLVPVMKPNGKDIRVCANYKVTVNKYLRDVNYPIPRIEEIFVALQEAINSLN